jgi:hypothetical protein
MVLHCPDRVGQHAFSLLMEALLCVSAHRDHRLPGVPCVNPRGVGLDIGSEEIGGRLADWLAACQDGGHAHKGSALRFDTGGRASMRH